MFPIRDVRGRVIAFGGRIIDQGEPKYLNSPETALFHKGRELYGLYEARRYAHQPEAAVGRRRLYGRRRLHQSGIDYAVATLGTATTPEHLKQIFRLVSEVVFAFDGDRAGRAAAWRALQHALPEAREGREIRFLFLPEGHDPDTLVGEEGREAFEKRLESTSCRCRNIWCAELSEQADLAAPAAAHGSRRAQAAVREGAGRRVSGAAAGADRRSRRHDGRAICSAGGDAAPMRARPGRRPRRARPFPGDPLPSGRRRKAPAHAQSSAGRGSLVRQAIARLVSFPSIAQEVTARSAPDSSSARSLASSCCASCWTTCAASPRAVPAQVIERWADRPRGRGLWQKLLQREEILGDAAAAARS